MPDEKNMNLPPAESTGDPEEAEDLESVMNAREAARVAGVPYHRLLSAIRLGFVEATTFGSSYALTRETVVALRDRVARLGAGA